PRRDGANNGPTLPPATVAAHRVERSKARAPPSDPRRHDIATISPRSPADPELLRRDYARIRRRHNCGPCPKPARLPQRANRAAQASTGRTEAMAVLSLRLD